MKVYISKYRSHWLSPYTILEKVLFWEDSDTIYGLKKEIGDNVYLSSGIFDPNRDKYADTKPYIAFLLRALEPVCDVILKVLDTIHPKIDYVKIDRWDTWSMDHTLALIILPMLKQLKDTKHGVPSAFVHNADGTEIPFEIAEKKWDATLDKMIWSFEQIIDEDIEDQFHTGGGEFNVKGYQKHQKKVQEGLDLFGKYFRNLWD
jgi:hypothetical protein